MTPSDLGSLAAECQRLIDEGVVFNDQRLEQGGKKISGRSLNASEAAQMWRERMGDAVSPAAAKNILSRNLPPGNMQVQFTNVIGDTTDIRFFAESPHRPFSTVFNLILEYKKGASRLELSNAGVLQKQRGLGRQLAYNSVQLAQDMGLNSVSLSAIEVGAYTWARCGFIPYQESWNSLSAKIKNRIQDIPDLPENVKRTLNRLLSSKDPRTIWVLADLKEPMVTTPPDIIKDVNREHTISLGKALLVGLVWSGTLNFSHEKQMQRFNAYVTPTQMTFPPASEQIGLS